MTRSELQDLGAPLLFDDSCAIWWVGIWPNHSSNKIIQENIPKSMIQWSRPESVTKTTDSATKNRLVVADSVNGHNTIITFTWQPLKRIPFEQNYQWKQWTMRSQSPCCTPSSKSHIRLHHINNHTSKCWIQEEIKYPLLLNRIHPPTTNMAISGKSTMNEDIYIYIYILWKWWFSSDCHVSFQG